MFGFLNTLTAPKVDYVDLIDNGAIVLDVRTKEEYKFGHIDNSVNIPLDQLAKNIKRFSKKKAIITCCQSGARSGLAKRILEEHGIEAYNGGGWSRLQRFL